MFGRDRQGALEGPSPREVHRRGVEGAEGAVCSPALGRRNPDRRPLDSHHAASSSIGASCAPRDSAISSSAYGSRTITIFGSRQRGSGVSTCTLAGPFGSAAATHPGAGVRGLPEMCPDHLAAFRVLPDRFRGRLPASKGLPDCVRGRLPAFREPSETFRGLRETFREQLPASGEAPERLRERLPPFPDHPGRFRVLPGAPGTRNGAGNKRNSAFSILPGAAKMKSLALHHRR